MRMAQRNPGLMGNYAGFVTRGAALIIDILIVIVSVLVITAAISLPLSFFLNINAQSCAAGVDILVLSDGWNALPALLCDFLNISSLTIALLTGPIYFIFLATAGGQTVGKHVMGVRVVRLDGKPMTYLDSAQRWLGYLLSLAPLGLGFLWVIVDDRRRGFHDKVAGTCVIYSWRAQQNEFLLSRLHRFFGRASKRGRVALMRVLATQHFELVMISVPNFGELNSLLRIVKNGIQNGDFEVLGLQEYAKNSNGQISYLDVDPMLDGVSSIMQFSEYGGLSAEKIAQIREELPNDHFILAVLIDEKDADQLVKLVARRTAAQIRRYELHHVVRSSLQTDSAASASDGGEPVAADLPSAHTKTDQGMEPIAAAFLATVPVVGAAPTVAPAAQAPVQQSSTAKPAIAETPVTPMVEGRPATPETLKPSESAVEANGAAANGNAALLPDLLAAITELKEQQAALQSALQMALAAKADVSDPPTAPPADNGREPASSPAATIAAIAEWQHRYPALSDLGEALLALPENKTAAIDAAVAARVMPNVVNAPQDLAAIRGIGPVFEQRLYRAGIGAFWEVATLIDADLSRILALTDLQLKQIDLAALREDARRLAIESGTVGMIWQGDALDDFEPIEGIGPVFEQRLYDAGIRSYAALATSTPAELARIVKAPKPSQPDYASWIEQAARLRDGS
jgi:predicted flap endonuclease-1-like 5' DNA nuclease/uncharacterized RDD family membrane protein YckC